MLPDPSKGILARLGAAKPRRWFGVAVIGGLGALLIYLSTVSLGGFASRAMLFAMGLFAFYIATRFEFSTRGELLLTENGIEDADRRVLVEWANMTKVERGVFALKPSNGFTVRTKTPMQREWAPGLWWRFGKRFGVGGVSAAGASKFMAEQIAMRLDDSV